MNVTQLKPGEQIALADGALAEVLVVLEDGSGVQVKYIDTMGEPEKVGTEETVSADDVISVMEGTHTEGSA